MRKARGEINKNIKMESFMRKPSGSLSETVG